MARHRVRRQQGTGPTHTPARLVVGADPHVEPGLVDATSSRGHPADDSRPVVITRHTFPCARPPLRIGIERSAGRSARARRPRPYSGLGFDTRIGRVFGGPRRVDMERIPRRHPPRGPALAIRRNPPPLRRESSIRFGSSVGDQAASVTVQGGVPAAPSGGHLAAAFVVSGAERFGGLLGRVLALRLHTRGVGHPDSAGPGGLPATTQSPVSLRARSRSP